MAGWVAYGFFGLIMMGAASMVFGSFLVAKTRLGFMVMNVIVALAGVSLGVWSYMFFAHPFENIMYYVAPFFVWGGMGLGWLAIFVYLMRL